MMSATAPVRYRAFPIAVHWSTAVAIGWLLFSGFRIASTGDPTAKAGMLRIHIAVGIIVAVLTLIRVAWWVFVDRKPPAPKGMPALQVAAAHALHGAFYVVIFTMAASGVAMMATSGAGPIVFGGSGAPLPDFQQFIGRVPHGLAGRMMLGLIALHVAAALYHQFVVKDRILARMGIGPAT
jgi:cytochrome b561